MTSRSLCYIRHIISGRTVWKKDFCRKLTSSSILLSGTGGQGGGDGETGMCGDGDGDRNRERPVSGHNAVSSPADIPSGEKLDMLEFKRRRYRSTLSVADRITQMLPGDYDNALKESGVTSDTVKGVSIGDVENLDDKGNFLRTEEKSAHTETSPFSNDSVAMQPDDAVSDSPSDGRGKHFSANPDEDLPFVAGELAIASREIPKRHEHLRKMFTINPSKTFNCKFGAIKHSDIIGRIPGDSYVLSRGHRVSIERATLEDYIVLMKRTPVISYPKDCITMSMLIDANPGDTILEAGSGSGGMTLYLSRAVGPTGHVHAFEMNEKHHGRAVKNFNRWQQSWNLSRPGRQWPSNVIFHHQRLQDGDDTLGDMMFDGAIIDMQNPHLTMPFIARRIKAGRSVAIYLTNLTQVIQTLEYIEAKKVPLENTRVLDVTHRTWCVIPARRHDGQLVKSVNSDEEEMEVPRNEYEDSSSEDSSDFDEDMTEDEPVYLAKPSFYQHPHTAFLLRLRKCKPL